jgi:hypothetical protein
MSKKYHEHKALGLCVYCDLLNDGTSVFCEEHHKNQNKQSKKQRGKRIQNGLCGKCTNPAEPGLKLCTKCREYAEVSRVKLVKRKKLFGICVDCSNPTVEGTCLCKKHLNNRRTKEQNKRITNPEVKLLNGSKTRAKRNNIEFTITEKDVVIPIFCRYLHIPLIQGIGGFIDNSPTLDRVDNTKGYIPGNIEVISYKANRMKSNATQEELLSFAQTIEEDFINKWRKELNI